MQQAINPTTSIAYPATYQRELSPSWLHFAATLSNAAVHDVDQPFRYLELGCGRGNSALFHAASYRHGEFHALDCDAAAITSARERAKASGLNNIRFHLATFENALRLDLPAFDFIAMHGVYSWVHETQRANLRRLLEDRLAPGGLAYVSYNAMPGWVAELPLRRLFHELRATHAADGAEGVRWARHEVERLRACGFRFFAAHPTAERAVASWAEQDAGYLAHEYLADGWEPLWSVDVIGAMAAAGLRYVGSATLWDNHEELLFPAATSRAIARLKTARLRILACDLALNRGFRRDLYVRADGAPYDGRKIDAVKKLVVGCPGDANTIPEHILVPRGRVRFRAEFIAALRGLMDGGPRQVGGLAGWLGGPERETIRNLLWLTAAGSLVPIVRRDESAGYEPRRADAGSGRDDRLL